MNTPVTPTRRLDSDEILPEKTPLLVGLGVVIEGTIRYETKDPEDRLVILGQVLGDIFTNGILQIAQGATVRPVSKIECAEIIISGTLEGDNVVVSTNLLQLQPTAKVRVDTLRLPPGGLEQSRGSMLNAKLDMSDEHQFTMVPCKPAASGSSIVPTVTSTTVAQATFVKPDAAHYVGVTLPGDENTNDPKKTVVESSFAASADLDAVHA